jgi:arsenate reductase
MAEGLARHFWGPSIKVLSAGSKPGGVNPLAIQAMQEIGIDISHHTSKAVDEIELTQVDLVITLCAEEVCPVALVKAGKRLHWGVEDPASQSGSPEQRLESFRVARNRIQNYLAQFTMPFETA